MFELVVIGANAKNILILRSNSGMEENAMKPVGVRRNQTLPCYLCVSFGSLMHVCPLEESLESALTCKNKCMLVT